MRKTTGKSKGFSLVELVVVIVIIGIIAAMAIPRLSRGAAGASDAALTGNLAMIRNAINLYAAEHNNKFPSAAIVTEMAQYSSVTGATSTTKSATFKYGPYLVAMPPCPVGTATSPTAVLIDAVNSPPTVNTLGGEGWAYNPNTGEFIANTTDPDEFGKAYNTF